eukprot:GHRR01029752.1.p1 GENE.GHRR01029752.1~~GHRR01029752.1.p1  ORF type:complete len:153 (+),score=34.41 GHRR01029752.1:416-874(+)
MDPAVDYVPVLGLLERASNELEVGQLIHTSVFSLFEAMSAVEIGNPRMDAGARPKGDATPLEQRQLQLNLSPAQLLGVMDHLLCLEATWHNGGSLARTVYSSLYMMQPQRYQVLWCRCTCGSSKRRLLRCRAHLLTPQLVALRQWCVTEQAN